LPPNKNVHTGSTEKQRNLERLSLVTVRTAQGAKKFMLKIFHNKPVRRGGCGMNTLERCECQSGRAALFGWKVQHLREVSFRRKCLKSLTRNFQETNWRLETSSLLWWNGSGYSCCQPLTQPIKAILRYTLSPLGVRYSSTTLHSLVIHGNAPVDISPLN